MTLPLLALRDSGVELGDGGWCRYEWVHRQLVADELAYAACRSRLVDHTAHESGHPTSEITVVLFTYEELLDSWEKHHHEWFGTDPEAELPSNACALVCYWQPPVEVTIDERPRCPRCGTPMNAGTAFLCGGPAGGGRLDLPPTCPSRECRSARDEAVLADAIARGVIDP